MSAGRIVAYFSVALMAFLSINYCLAENTILGDEMMDNIADGILDGSIPAPAGLAPLYCFEISVIS
jgi:hypothetical protein